MFLNKTTEYALTVLSYMATRDHGTYTAELLHGELNIPRQYLRRLMTTLSKLGFIAGARGRSGGFVIARALEDIHFSDIVLAMEGEESMHTCLLGFSACIVDHPCAMHELWSAARNKVMETLSGTSLADLRTKYMEAAIA